MIFVGNISKLFPLPFTINNYLNSSYQPKKCQEKHFLPEALKILNSKLAVLWSYMKAQISAIWSLSSTLDFLTEEKPAF